MRNDGKSFEQLVLGIFQALSGNPRYTSVEHDVQLEGADGPRQVDIVIRAKISTFDILTIIECKDYSKILDITAIDALHSKQLDVKANKAVLVSKKGFSAKAVKKAKRLGISLYKATMAAEDIRDIGIQVPIIVHEITTLTIQPQFKLHIPENTSFKYVGGVTINDVVIYDFFRDALLNGRVPLNDTKEVQYWKPAEFINDAYTRDAANNKLPIQNVEIQYQFESAYYFGYLSDLHNSTALIDMTGKEKHLVFRAEEIIFDYRKLFSRYASKSEVPQVQVVPISAITVPVGPIGKHELKFIHLDTGNVFHATASRQ